MSSNGRVQIRDFSDREILLMMLDLGGDVATLALAQRIYGWNQDEVADVKNDDVTRGCRCVSSRLTWMRRFGLVESMIEVDPPHARSWQVSAPGKTMVGFTLPNVVESTMMRMSDSADLVLANRLGERLVKAGEITGTAMRRELQFAITRRKRSRA
jgi:hypothetical protein